MRWSVVGDSKMGDLDSVSIRMAKEVILRNQAFFAASSATVLAVGVGVCCGVAGGVTTGSMENAICICFIKP